MQTVRTYAYCCVALYAAKVFKSPHAEAPLEQRHCGNICERASLTVVSVFLVVVVDVVECDGKCHLHFDWCATPPHPSPNPSCCLYTAAGKHLRQLKSAQNEVAAAVWKVLEVPAWSCCTRFIFNGWGAIHTPPSPALPALSQPAEWLSSWLAVNLFAWWNSIHLPPRLFFVVVITIDASFLFSRSPSD